MPQLTFADVRKAAIADEMATQTSAELMPDAVGKFAKGVEAEWCGCRVSVAPYFPETPLRPITFELAHSRAADWKAATAAKLYIAM